MAVFIEPNPPISRDRRKRISLLYYVFFSFVIKHALYVIKFGEY